MNPPRQSVLILIVADLSPRSSRYKLLLVAPIPTPLHLYKRSAIPATAHTRPCPECGGELRLVGEDVSEILEMITAKLQVIEVARPKRSCRCCEKMVQVPAPTRPIPGSMAGGSLLAYVLISKFDDHLPLYRQNEIIARMGADIPRSTLADWCGRSMRILQPVIDRIEASVLGSDILHADDTPIRVLAPERRAKGIGKGVMQGRIWGYVCDQRPWAGTAPPGVVYRYAPNWKAEHVLAHLCAATDRMRA